MLCCALWKWRCRWFADAISCCQSCCLYVLCVYVNRSQWRPSFWLPVGWCYVYGSLLYPFTTHRCILYIYDGRSKCSQPHLVLFRIKLKYYLLLIVARLRTQHAQSDFWAINILYILGYERCQMVSRMLTSCTQVSEEQLKRYRRDPANIYITTRYSGWNMHQQLRFWVRATKHAMEWTNQSKLSFHYTA